MSVVITSRVPNGRVLPNYGFDGGGKTLVNAGAVMGDDFLRKRRVFCSCCFYKTVRTIRRTSRKHLAVERPLAKKT